MSSESAPQINLEFLPDWARQPASQPGPVSRSDATNRPAREERSQPPRRDRDDRSPRRGPPQGGGGGGRGPRSGGDRGGPRGQSSDRQGRGPRPNYQQNRPPVPQAPCVEIHFLPEEKALQSVVEQIRVTARAYPLFSLAKMFLEKPERHQVLLKPIPPVATQLTQCTVCETLFLDSTTALSHMLRSHRSAYYEQVREATEAPKGNFTSVARCDLNGALLGPSNHHAYQANVMQLYKAQFRNMSFDRFKESIRSVQDPVVVQKWRDAASWKTTFKTLQTAEAKVLLTEGEVEKHFKEVHFPTLTRQALELTVPGPVSRHIEDSRVSSSLRRTWEEENRYPGNTARRLREAFFKAGLFVFKGRKGMQFVTLCRPKALVADPVQLSPSIRAMLDYLKAHPSCDRKTLLDAVSPPVEAGAVTPPAVVQDLLWLVHQGHVIEYHNGQLEMPPIPGPKPTPKIPAAAKSAGAPAAAEAAPAESVEIEEEEGLEGEAETPPAESTGV